MSPGQSGAACDGLTPASPDDSSAARMPSWSAARVINRSSGCGAGCERSSVSRARCGATETSRAMTRCSPAASRTERGVRVIWPTHSVWVPLQYGVSVYVAQLQLPPRATAPMNAPACKGCALAGGAAKKRGCSASKRSGIDRSCAPCRSAAKRRPASSTYRMLALRHDMTAGPARAVLDRAVEALEHRRQLRHDVAHVQILGIQRVVAALAEPEKTVLFLGPALALDHQAHGVGEALRRMGHVGRQQQDFALTNGDVDALAVLDGPQQHVAFELVEEFLARVVVIVGAGVRPADHHDDELGVAEHLAVAHRRLEEFAVLVDPSLKIERLERFHAAKYSRGRSQSPILKPEDEQGTYTGSPGASSRTAHSALPHTQPVSMLSTPSLS